MIILHFHLQPQFKNELFHILHINLKLVKVSEKKSVLEDFRANVLKAKCWLRRGERGGGFSQKHVMIPPLGPALSVRLREMSI